MGEYLTFKKHLTPAFIQILFWILLFANTMEAFFGGHDFWGALFTLFVGPVLLRIGCELILVLFEINDNLDAIRISRAAPPVAVITPVSSVEPPLSSTDPIV